MEKNKDNKEGAKKASNGDKKSLHVLKVNYGTLKSGKPRHAKGSKIALTEAQKNDFQSKNYI